MDINKTSEGRKASLLASSLFALFFSFSTNVGAVHTLSIISYDNRIIHEIVVLGYRFNFQFHNMQAFERAFSELSHHNFQGIDTSNLGNNNHGNLDNPDTHIIPTLIVEKDNAPCTKNAREQKALRLYPRDDYPSGEITVVWENGVSFYNWDRGRWGEDYWQQHEGSICTYMFKRSQRIKRYRNR